jgi:cell division protein FtsB
MAAMSSPDAGAGPATASLPATPRSRRRLRLSGETRRRRGRLIGFGLFGASFIFMVNALVGENGYVANLRAQLEYDALMSSIGRLRHENQQLLDDIHRLKRDPAALEETARRQLGLARPGEILVIIRDQPPATSATSVPPPK